MKRIKVLHLTSTRYGIGGVERLLLDLADKWDAERFEISYSNLFSERGADGAYPSELEKRGLRYLNIGGRRWFEVPLMFARLSRMLRREQFDIIHLHMMQATIMGGLAARFAKGARVVVTKHYTHALSTHHPKPLVALDRHITRTASRVVAISDFVMRDMAAAGIPSSIMTVIPNGTDLDEFDRQAAETVETPFPGKRVIGTVGSLTTRKGHAFLLRAFARLSADRPDLRLVIIGEGPELEHLKRLMRELAIEDKVQLTGFVPNVAAYLKNFDLYVHPAAAEPFGIAVLEAMAARKCVIATAVEGVPEIIDDGVTGYLVEYGDEQGLAERLGRALDDEAASERIESSARSEVEARFSIHKTVAGYEALYEAALKGGNALGNAPMV